jgi:hypothetical protein
MRNPWGNIDMLSSAYFRQQAAVCRRLAMTLSDQTAAAILAAMAADFTVKAAEIEQITGLNGDALKESSKAGAISRQARR